MEAQGSISNTTNKYKYKQGDFRKINLDLMLWIGEMELVWDGEYFEGHCYYEPELVNDERESGKGKGFDIFYLSFIIEEQMGT